MRPRLRSDCGVPREMPEVQITKHNRQLVHCSGCQSDEYKRNREQFVEKRMFDYHKVPWFGKYLDREVEAGGTATCGRAGREFCHAFSDGQQRKP